MDGRDARLHKELKIMIGWALLKIIAGKWINAIEGVLTVSQLSIQYNQRKITIKLAWKIS